MRAMNGRLQSVLRSPLMHNSQLNNMPTNGQQQQRHGHPHHHHHHHHRRRDSDTVPRMVQFDEGAEEYRCFCGCFHIKTGTLIVAGIELFLILFFFVNAFLVSLQQKQGYDYKRGDRSSDYVHVAFIITGACCGIATLCVLLMVLGVVKNVGALLFPMLVVQIISLLTFALLAVVGVVAVCTDLAIFYRILNAAPFHEYPGQSTVALPAETAARVYLLIGMHLLSLVFGIYATLLLYNCQRYFAERKQYMRYCMAYSKPMETLNSAR